MFPVSTLVACAFLLSTHTLTAHTHSPHTLTAACGWTPNASALTSAARTRHGHVSAPVAVHASRFRCPVRPSRGAESIRRARAQGPAASPPAPTCVCAHHHILHGPRHDHSRLLWNISSATHGHTSPIFCNSGQGCTHSPRALALTGARRHSYANTWRANSGGPDTHREIARSLSLLLVTNEGAAYFSEAGRAAPSSAGALGGSSGSRGHLGGGHVADGFTAGSSRGHFFGGHTPVS